MTWATFRDLMVIIGIIVIINLFAWYHWQLGGFVVSFISLFVVCGIVGDMTETKLPVQTTARPLAKVIPFKRKGA